MCTHCRCFSVRCFIFLFPHLLQEIRRLGTLGIEYVQGGITRPAASVDGTPNPLSQEGTELSVLVGAEGDPESGESMSKMLEAQIFRGVDRLKLINMIIVSKGPGGCALDIRRLLKDKCILAYMPLHDMVELRALESNWLTFFDWPWNQPTDQIKDYFGEKIGLYFKWLGMYTTWLVVAAMLGFGFWINVATDSKSNVCFLPKFVLHFIVTGQLSGRITRVSLKN
jgi:hypothetical protein